MIPQSTPLPPLEWIRAFEAAARHGSFTAAATECGLTQSAISQRIAHLEQRLGVRLFDRSGRRISLTVKGEAWLPHVANALRALGDSTETLFGTAPRSVTLTASQSVIQLWLMPRLARLGPALPFQLQVQTMVTGAHDVPPDGALHIRYGSGDWPHPLKRPLYGELIAPLAAPSMRALGDDWTRWPRIACAGARPGWTDWAGRFGGTSTPVPPLRVDTFAAAHQAACAGLGVVLGSLPLCAGALENGALIRLDPRALEHHQTYWLIGAEGAVSRSQWHALDPLFA